MRRAPPSVACLDKLHGARLGGTYLALPLAPPIKVGLGWEHSPSYLFEINQHARDFCGLAVPGPVELTNVRFDLDRILPVDSSQSRRVLCARQRQAAWWPATCGREKTVAEDYPVK